MPLVAAAFEPAQAETVEGAAAAFGWRPGIIPSTLLVAAAEAAAGRMRRRRPSDRDG